MRFALMTFLDSKSNPWEEQAIFNGVSSRIVYVGNACDSYPCWNDAFCIPLNLSVSSFKCICGSEYAGELCQYKVNDFCKGQHCDEGTVCTVTNGFAECVSYDSLAYFSSCDETFCLNGAQCVPAINNRFKCLCADGYQGVYCQLDSSAHIATFSITTTVFLFGLVLLIVLSVLLICHSSNIGCYLLMPGESNYTRWDDEDGEPDDDRIPLEMIRSGTQDGIKSSATSDTFVDLEGPSMQRTSRQTTADC